MALPTTTLYLVRENDTSGGTEDERTYFAIPRQRWEGEDLTLLLPKTDPRSETNLGRIHDSAAQFRSLGLDPDQHRFRPCHRREVTILREWENWRVPSTEPEFKVGDRVRIVEASHVAAIRCVGSVGILTRTDATGLYGGVLHPYWVRVMEGHDPHEYGASEVEHVNTEPQPGTLEEAEARLAALKADTKKMAEALRQEAVDRGWCEEYEDFVNKVNPTLSEPLLETRPRWYEVTVAVRAEYTGSNSDEASAAMVSEVTRALSHLDPLTVEVHRSRRRS